MIVFDNNYMIKYIKARDDESEVSVIDMAIDDLERKIKSLKKYRSMLLMHKSDEGF